VGYQDGVTRRIKGTKLSEGTRQIPMQKGIMPKAFCSCESVGGGVAGAGLERGARGRQAKALGVFDHGSVHSNSGWDSHQLQRTGDFLSRPQQALRESENADSSAICGSAVGPARRSIARAA
jgi:hypothetical protein